MTVAHAVILSHGPGSLTRRAVRRLRRAGGVAPLVVRASPAAPMLPDMVTPTKTGTRALEEALDSIPSDLPAFVVHDDVVLTPQAYRAMLGTLAEGEAPYVVPYTNDEHMDHGIGALPGELDRLSRFRGPSANRRVRRVRPSAILGRVDDLKLLLSRHLADPRTRFDDVSMGFVAAGGAVAYHEGSCATRLATPDDGPFLVAALIVKDEEKMLPECLASLDGLVDRIEVCDTGSTDRTVEIARRAGAHVIERTWRNDFAWARNQALEQCTDATWALVIDADERVQTADKELIRRLLATYGEEYESLRVPVINVEGSRTSRFFSTRLIHPASARYVGAVHEMPRTIGREHEPIPYGTLELLSLVHHGYEQQVIVERDKPQRNLAIAKAAYEREPTPKTALELARSLMLDESFSEETVDLLDEALVTGQGQHPSISANIFTLRARALIAIDRPEEAQSSLEAALNLVPADLMAAALLGDVAKKLDTPERYVTSIETARSRASVHPLHLVESETARISSRLSWAYARLDRVTEALREAEQAAAAGGFDEWTELFTMLRDADRFEDAVSVVIRSPNISYAEPAAKILGVEAAAILCLEHLEAEPTRADVVEFGMIASMVAGRDDLVAEFAPSVDLLEPETRSRLLERAEARGDRGVVRALEAVGTSAAS